MLDIRLPVSSGLEFQSDLAKANVQDIPIVFMTGHGDIRMTVRALKAGAIELPDQAISRSGHAGCRSNRYQQDRKRLQIEETAAKLKASFELLTSREQEIMGLVTTGLMNKQIAAKLGVSEITVKVHRGSVMRKMGAKSLADLIRIAEALGVCRPIP